jgi:3-methylcrotonyl-CoA carboxylase alpha subunit
MDRVWITVWLRGARFPAVSGNGEARMFRKILIANRGEIAVRVIRTCRTLGVATVAVHSDVDAGALHVALADEAVAIGGAQPAESYLRADRIVAAARDTGAEAIHPGYGFLSENPEFVEAVEAAGLVFIGPSAAAIRAMGLKDAAKRLMAEAGVPVVPGYHGADQDPGHLEVEAAAVGYPVLIKAVAGGGGKGMRRVESPADFMMALEGAKAEARGAFGNDAVLIEKYVDKPRHIEVQVFGDGERAVHLFERDCSLQRRHQKVIEEAPAPGMTAEVRAAMGAAAVRAAEAIGYAGAGTVEFIVDGSRGLRPDGFWFMEMNTRLQVEHPVTEAVTGVDLVEWQLRVASGESLWVVAGGCALARARLRGAALCGGRAKGLSARHRAARASGLSPRRAGRQRGRAGDAISPFYDPMIAKIIVEGPTRAAALAKLRAALAGDGSGRQRHEPRVPEAAGSPSGFRCGRRGHRAHRARSGRGSRRSRRRAAGWSRWRRSARSGSMRTAARWRGSTSGRRSSAPCAWSGAARRSRRG